MAIPLFLLGRPGSGKSKAARFMVGEALWPIYRWGRSSGLEGLRIQHLNDYSILHQMFEREQRTKKKIQQKHFRESRQGNLKGFEVLNPAVLPRALQQLGRSAHAWLPVPKTLLLLEFARGAYPADLWSCFPPQLLENAYYLFFQADLDLCVERVRQRSSNAGHADDHYVSEEVIRKYYQEDGQTSLLANRERARVGVIGNNGASWHSAWLEVRTFLEKVFAQTIVPTERFLINLNLSRVLPISTPARRARKLLPV